MIGVNLAGAEFGSGRGVYGTHYIYPGANELDYYKSKGIELIRLPFGWERMQPQLGGDLSESELARMMKFLDAAEQRGMSVVVDLHNYGRYDGNTIGSSDVPIAAFADFWTRLADALKEHPAVWGLGIMNEPHDMGGKTVWPAAAQAAVDGIRSTGSNQTIVVSGDNWSGAHSWKTYNAGLIIADPLDKLLYEAHQYFDRGSTGIYRGYDEEGAYPTIGVDRLQPFLDWLTENNLRGFIGEYGVPDNDPRWLTVLDHFVRALDRHDLPSAYWAGGPWWGQYALAIEPRGGDDRPQMDVLERHLKHGDDVFPTTLASNVDGGIFDDVVYRSVANGQLIFQDMDAGVGRGFDTLTAPLTSDWIAIGKGEFSGDGRADVFVWNKALGQVFVLAPGAEPAEAWTLVANGISANFSAVGAADIDGDRFADMLVHDAASGTLYWRSMANGSPAEWGTVGANLGAAWTYRAAGDVTGDGFADVVIQHDSGRALIADMAGGANAGYHDLGNIDGFAVRAAGDVNADGFADVIVQDETNGRTLWSDFSGNGPVWNVAADPVGTDWIVRDAAFVDGNGSADLVYQHAVTGETLFLAMDRGVAIHWGVASASLGGEWLIV